MNERTETDECKYVSIESIVPGEDEEHHSERGCDEVELNKLVESIKINGMLAPLLVEEQADQYRLIVGNRRLRAAKLAGLKEVPILIRQNDADQGDGE